jgi:hypothetical protein
MNSNKNRGQILVSSNISENWDLTPVIRWDVPLLGDRGDAPVLGAWGDVPLPGDRGDGPMLGVRIDSTMTPPMLIDGFIGAQDWREGNQGWHQTREYCIQQV